jgi:hypothetical protein
MLPLLKKLSTDVIYLEKVEFDDLSESEKESIIQGRIEYDNDELIDLDDYMAKHEQ